MDGSMVTVTVAALAAGLAAVVTAVLAAAATASATATEAREGRASMAGDGSCVAGIMIEAAH